MHTIRIIRLLVTVTMLAAPFAVAAAKRAADTPVRVEQAAVVRLDRRHADHKRIVKDGPLMDASTPEHVDSLRGQAANGRRELVREADHSGGQKISDELRFPSCKP